jgi:uncharacterized protein (TIGR02145 family)
MKSVLLMLMIFAFAGLKSSAQNYLISFAGSGQSINVTSVIAQNLSTGSTLSLNGNDILRLSGTDGIIKPVGCNLPALRVYPNPMTNSSTLEIIPPVSGEAIVSVYSVTGEVILQLCTNLEPSGQEFRLGGLKSGFYLIHVKGNAYQSSSKLFVNVENEGELKLEKVSSGKESALVNAQKKNFSDGISVMDMQYKSGERLKFTAVSGDYSTVLTDIPTSDKTISFDFITCTDGDNQHYPVVKIGNQTWMAANLRTTRYRNGELIGTTSPDTLDVSVEVEPKYQWAAEGIEGKAEVYGRLYTGYTIFDNRKICPEGWKVPDDADWTILTNYLGGARLSIDKLKETTTDHWYSPNTSATNESGFTGLPSGIRYYNGSFFETGSTSNWWSSTKYDTNKAWSRSINIWDAGVAAHYYFLNFGFSVRCLQESNAGTELPSVGTLAVTGITSVSALSGGNNISDGGAEITEKGVCWGTNSKPTLALGTKTLNGGGNEPFVSIMTGLEPGVNYYVRAYANNSAGTVYGNEVNFTTNTTEGEIGFNPDLKYGIAKDTAGNSYKTIVIGSQIWMAENLRTNKYNDGTAIPFVSDRNVWINLNTPAYCWYNNDSTANSYLYGASYNWQTINTGKLCPQGWHVPHDNEWTVLTNYLGGEEMAGAKMKERGTTHWTKTNPNSTNESGFTALPGGYSGYSYDFKGVAGTWWSLNEDDYNKMQAWERTIYNEGSSVVRNTSSKENGLSVRCISDLQPVITQAAVKTSIATDIALTGAICGGIVTSDGGDSITERGICWGTNSFPLKKGNHLQDTSGKDTFYISMNNLYENTTYFVRAYATNSAGTFYGNEVSFKTLASDFTIGQPYQGGLIAYIFKPGDPGYVAGEKHGLIVASSDQSTGIKWFKDYSVSIVTGTLLGTGAYNTSKIVETQGSGNFAADLCLNLVLEGYSDWYLPSRDELNILFLHKSEINMLEHNTYWSSSEKDIFKAWVQYFYDGVQDYGGKTSMYCVRAVRNF